MTTEGPSVYCTGAPRKARARGSNNYPELLLHHSLSFLNFVDLKVGSRVLKRTSVPCCVLCLIKKAIISSRDKECCDRYCHLIRQG